MNRYDDLLLQASQQQEGGHYADAMVTLRLAMRYTTDAGERDGIARWMERLSDKTEGEEET